MILKNHSSLPVLFVSITSCTVSVFQICSEECSNKGGTQDGSCANGYGVCCICKWIMGFLLFK